MHSSDDQGIPKIKVSGHFPEVPDSTFSFYKTSKGQVKILFSIHGRHHYCPPGRHSELAARPNLAPAITPSPNAPALQTVFRPVLERAARIAAFQANGLPLRKISRTLEEEVFQATDKISLEIIPMKP